MRLLTGLAITLLLIIILIAVLAHLEGLSA
jgi:hypothetical protein